MLDSRHEVFLTELGAKEVEHSGRTLYDHLKGTHDILQQWKSPAEVCLAGLFHSIYGTEYFKHASLPLDRRHVLQELIGAKAEELAYQFCTTPRAELKGTSLLAIKHANQLEQEFERCWPWLEAALAREVVVLKDGTRLVPYHKEHVLQLIVAWKYRLWAFKNCAFLTQVRSLPTGLKLHHTWLVGGNSLKDIVAKQPIIEEFGRKNGCHQQTGHGRRAWLRVFTGYRETGVRKAKDL